MNKKKKGSILSAVIVVLFSSVVLAISIAHIHYRNKKQYQLIKEGYELSILLEMSTLAIKEELLSQEIVDTFQYPQKIVYSIGEVDVLYQEKARRFLLNAKIKNGKRKTETIDIDFEEVK